MKTSFWILMIVAVLVVVFSVQNAGTVAFSFFAWKGEMSLAILLIIAFIVGALVGALYYRLAMRKKKNVAHKDIAGDIPFERVKDRNTDEGI